VTTNYLVGRIFQFVDARHFSVGRRQLVDTFEKSLIYFVVRLLANFFLILVS